MGLTIGVFDLIYLFLVNWQGSTPCKNLVYLLDNDEENIDIEKMISPNQMSLVMSNKYQGGR